MSLVVQKSIPDLLITIELQLVALGWVKIHRCGDRRTAELLEPRVLKWAIASCIKAGISESFLMGLLERTPSEGHWHRVRAYLPESALYVLNGKLEGFLIGEEC